MKKLIFIITFFFVSIISFGQTNFITENFSHTYACDQIRYATYKFSTKEILDVSIKSFNDYTESVSYNYSTKKLTISASPTKEIIEIDNVYVECYDIEAVKMYYVYKKYTYENKTIYGLMLVFNYFDSLSKTSHIMYVTKVLP